MSFLLPSLMAPCEAKSTNKGQGFSNQTHQAAFSTGGFPLMVNLCFSSVCSGFPAEPGRRLTTDDWPARRLEPGESPATAGPQAMGSNGFGVPTCLRVGNLEGSEPFGILEIQGIGVTPSSLRTGK